MWKAVVSSVGVCCICRRKGSTSRLWKQSKANWEMSCQWQLTGAAYELPCMYALYYLLCASAACCHLWEIITMLSGTRAASLMASGGADDAC